MTATSEVRRLIRELRRQGWTVQNTGSGHHKLTHPSGEFVFLPRSPSCRRWKKNATAWIRKVEQRAKEGVWPNPSPAPCVPSRTAGAQQTYGEE